MPRTFHDAVKNGIYLFILNTEFGSRMKERELKRIIAQQYDTVSKDYFEDIRDGIELLAVKNYQRELADEEEKDSSEEGGVEVIYESSDSDL